MRTNFQDDDRENRMIELFNLYKDGDEGRSGIDAFLDYQGQKIPFELKTTSQGSVTTVRDFGPDHIQKWKNMHWLIGFFMKGKEYYKYGSPIMMEPWIREKELYISPDFKLADLLPQKISLENMYEIISKKKLYKKEKYLALQDVENGYTPDRMLEILKDRVEYLIKRGSTLNNPHIPFSYFAGWCEITENHADHLRRMVKEYLYSL